MSKITLGQKIRANQPPPFAGPSEEERLAEIDSKNREAVALLFESFKERIAEDINTRNYVRSIMIQKELAVVCKAYDVLGKGRPSAHPWSEQKKDSLCYDLWEQFVAWGKSQDLDIELAHMSSGMGDGCWPDEMWIEMVVDPS